MKKLLIFLVSLCPFLSMAQNIIGNHKSDLLQYLNFTNPTKIISEGLVDKTTVPKYAAYRTDSIQVKDFNGLGLVYYFDKWGTCQELYYMHNDSNALMNDYISAIFMWKHHTFPAQPPFFKFNIDSAGKDRTYFCPNLNNKMVFFTEQVYLEYIKQQKND